MPERWGDLWNQRRRWSLGLAQVLRRHWRAVFTWRCRRFWPVVFESFLSILWGYSFVLLTLLWFISYLVGYPPVGGSPIPNWWGMLMATVCLGQLLTQTRFGLEGNRSQRRPQSRRCSSRARALERDLSEVPTARGEVGVRAVVTVEPRHARVTEDHAAATVGL